MGREKNIPKTIKVKPFLFLFSVPKKAKTKDTQKKRELRDTDKPGLLLLLGMLVVFYVCGSIVQWNLMIVFLLSIVFGVFLYWFGSQHEYV